jgi:hypothetical protein
MLLREFKMDTSSSTIKIDADMHAPNTKNDLVIYWLPGQARGEPAHRLSQTTSSLYLQFPPSQHGRIGCGYTGNSKVN